MNNPPNLEEWRRLYEVANQVKTLAPWNWMEETDIFGVQDPESEQIGFVSVMGELEVFYGISVYLNAEGLYGFWDLHSVTDHEPERLIEIPSLQVSYSNREQVEKEDRAIIQQLGLKFRGKHDWPIFRSFVPGYYPWFLEADEARFLSIALEQLLEVAPRVKQDPNLLDPYHDERYLIRIPHPQQDKLVWSEEYIPIYEAKPQSVAADKDKPWMKPLKGIQRKRVIAELDVFMIPNALQTGESRPFFPYILTIAIQRPQNLLGFRILTPEPSLAAMRDELTQQIAEIFAEAKVLPREIWIQQQREYLNRALTPLTEELGIKVIETPSLKTLNLVKETLLMMLTNPNAVDDGDFTSLNEDI
jgi:hypothetical protein